MTYLDFYQAWLGLVSQNDQIIKESVRNFCQNQSIPITVLIGICALILVPFAYDEEDNLKLAIVEGILGILGILCISYFAWDSLSEKSPPECRRSLFIEKSYSRTIYPEKDYTAEEFKKNIARIGQEASPEQIELAKTVFKNCLENLPYDYQVNHSSIVRSCIADEETKRIFEQKDTENEIKKVEIYKNKMINELN